MTFRTVLLAALSAPLAFSFYTYDYTDAPTAAPTTEQQCWMSKKITAPPSIYDICNEQPGYNVTRLTITKWASDPSGGYHLTPPCEYCIAVHPNSFPNGTIWMEACCSATAIKQMSICLTPF